MSKLRFEHAEFLLSCALPADFPKLLMTRGDIMPEIAVVGRSNVGKSSLINHLLRQKKLAKTSAKPGKTQTLNFFIVDKQVALVDLPGFGYAKVSKELRQTWGNTVTEYLSDRASLQKVLHLVDARRMCNEEDIGFMRWCFEKGKGYILVFTKCDQVDPQILEKNILSLVDSLKGVLPLEKEHCLAYTIKTDGARRALIQKIAEKE
jgi:GTP-binding protein